MIKKIVLLVIVTGLMYGAGGAADRSNNALPAGEETAPAAHNKLHNDLLILDDIGDDCVMFCNRIYEVSDYTIIKNERGTSISLESIPIPCEAMVSYYRKKGEHRRYVAVAIEVRGEAKPVPE